MQHAPLGHTSHDNVAPAFALLLLLISADLAFIVLHIVNVETSWLRATGLRFSLEADGGVPEMYQYVKQFWIAVCMAAAFWHSRVRIYLSWMVVFAFLMIDDAAQIHETVGAWLGAEYTLPSLFGLRADDSGELIVAAAVGTTMLVLVGAASLGGGEQSRRIARDVLLLVIVLAFLGVVVDMLHVIAYFNGSLLAQVLLLIEDGGEMIVVSALTAYAFHVAGHRGCSQLDLWAAIRARVWSRRADAASPPPLRGGRTVRGLPSGG